MHPILKYFRFNTVLVILRGFWGTTLSTGKQKRIPAEVPALEGLLYSYKHYGANVTHRKFWPIAGLMCWLRRQPNTCDVSFTLYFAF